MTGRCKSCNTILSDEEMTHKTLVNGKASYTELCTYCFVLSEDDTPDDMDYSGLFYNEGRRVPHKNE